jgi:thiol-disulfide isomerase/thioredoxin
MGENGGTMNKHLKPVKTGGRFMITVLFFVFAASLPLFAEAGVPEKVQTSFAKAGLPLLRIWREPKNFTLKTLDGKQVSLNELRGKVVFLNFWATWCGPCREEMPSMEALYQRLKNNDLEFIAVDIMENETDVGAFIKQNKINFPVALDIAGTVGSDYRVRGIPATFIINRNGKIIFAAAGARNWNAPAVVSAFEALLDSGI